MKAVCVKVLFMSSPEVVFSFGQAREALDCAGPAQVRSPGLTLETFWTPIALITARWWITERMPPLMNHIPKGIERMFLGA